VEQDCEPNIPQPSVNFLFPGTTGFLETWINEAIPASGRQTDCGPDFNTATLLLERTSLVSDNNIIGLDGNVD
jgi:hypothetical protein